MSSRMSPQNCATGTRTISPSSSADSAIWQDRRELGWGSTARVSIVAGGAAGLRHPGLVDIDVAGRAGAGAAALGQDPAHAILDGRFHHGAAFRGIDDLLSTAGLDKSDFHHDLTAIPIN